MIESLLRAVTYFCVDGDTPGAIVVGGNDDALSVECNPGWLSNSNRRKQCPADGIAGGNNGSSADGSDRSTSLSSGGIVGVAAAGLALLLVVLLFTRRRRKNLQHSDKVLPDYPILPVEGDESIYTEDTPGFASKIGSGSEIMDDNMVDTGSIKGSDDAISSESFDPKVAAGRDLGTFAASSKNITQYDTVSAAGVALLLKDGNDLSSSASKSSSAPAGTGDSAGPTQRFLEDLDAAIDEADWQAVWKLATNVSQKDDLSTLSGATGATGSVQGPGIGQLGRAGFFSSSVNRRRRPHLDPADEARASQLDDLVERQDWTAVAVTVAMFLRQNDPATNLAPLNQRRSIIDFVTGRRVSTAAAAAAGTDSEASSQRSGNGRVRAEPIAGPLPVVVSAKTDTASTSSIDNKKRPLLDKPEDSPARTADGTLTATGKSGSSPGINPALTVSDAPSSPANRMAAVAAPAPMVGAAMCRPRQTQPKKGRFFSFFKQNSGGHVLLELSSGEDSPGNPPKVFKDNSSPSRSSQDDSPGYRHTGSFLSSMGGSSLASLRTDLDRAVLRGDWAAVEALSAQRWKPLMILLFNDQIFPRQIRRRISSRNTDRTFNISCVWCEVDLACKGESLIIKSGKLQQAVRLQRLRGGSTCQPSATADSKFC